MNNNTDIVLGKLLANTENLQLQVERVHDEVGKLSDRIGDLEKTRNSLRANWKLLSIVATAAATAWEALHTGITHLVGK